MDKIPSILDVKSNVVYKETLLDIMCEGIIDTSSFRDCIEYTLDNKTHLFEGDEFKGTLYDGEEDILSIILPLIRKAWDRVYIHQPSSFNEDKRELLRLLFDIDKYLEYLSDIIPWCKGLSQFKYIDKTNETMKLIVDNYVASITVNIEKMEMMGQIESELLKLKRNESLKRILK